MTTRTALVTGATGYVGGLVVEQLLKDGWSVRTLTRSPEKLKDHPWHDKVVAIEGDATEPRDVAQAMEGANVAWYLLHSMGSGEDFAERDAHMAQIFADAASAAGLERLVYLSGLHPDEELSEHLASRVEVGNKLLASGVPTAVLQAAVVLGNGSISFTMLKQLAERLPAGVAPKWINNRIQPIAARDVLYYLVAAADLPADVNRTFDIGGPDVMTYAGMMQRYARALGFQPGPMLTAPVTTPGLAAHWIGLVTDIKTDMAKPLIGSLLHDTVVREHDIDDYIPLPPGGLMGFDDAVREAARGQTSSTWVRTALYTAGVVGVLAATAFLKGLRR
ncbi:NAD(P)H-binding protein [Tessaracoccus antarcticus]|uniref:NAD-dependent epimerase/dehydratase family protein n=1 Tax=Tessaracoccus antarcticus TaxID=2479848 RepID=A0A3M0G9I5_9ACTN|nr:NAD(P)H-binding protein [Tessaracoccus antarcticus]RMB61661.1 NAD-dependent epimerase/dehydratase family protein [Tessaracoccus antarcticus]